MRLKPHLPPNVAKILAKALRSAYVKTAVVGIATLFLLDWAFPLRTDVPYAPMVLAQDGTVLHAFLSKDQKWRFFAQPHEITPALTHAILEKEDRWFFYHLGVNPVALIRATFSNVLSGKRVSGASTITMQTVRLLEPRPRTYASKVLELLRAFQLEMHCAKAEILQLYLNLLPYGGNIEGLKAASLLYFGKPPQLLSIAELATLTIIPNRPSSLRPGRAGNVALRSARDAYLKRLAERSVISAAQLQDALREPIAMRRRAAPAEAPHLARRLVATYPGQALLYSTLQPTSQKTVEQLVKNYVARLRPEGIQNAAVLVADNQTGNVVAYVGSAGFYDDTDGGQVDGIRALRSPGSALKPLLYALAYDAGLITPKSSLNDVPTNFSGYEPANYDERFHGPVSAEFALANSLNLPAVKLLQDVGTPALAQAMTRAGMPSIRKQLPDLGLSLALGGCGVTLEELTTLYAGLAHNGRAVALRYNQYSSDDSKSSDESATDTLNQGAQFVSPEAAYLVTNTLSQITRPDLPDHFDHSYHLPRIAWKTGTSYGRRDAWSIGYNRRYTIGVWVGNFSGIGAPSLSGANTATPLLFQVFNALDYNSAARWFGAPKGLLSRAVCPVSGDVPGEGCTARTVDYYVPGVSRNRRCAHLAALLTDKTGRISYCAHCQPDSGAVKRYVPNPAPELLAWYAANRIPVALPPPHNPNCTRVFANGDAPRIVSLHDKSEYFIDPANPAELSLSSQTAPDVRTVFWYINDRFYRQARATDVVFFRPRPGPLRLSCTDDHGRVSSISVTVKRQ